MSDACGDVFSVEGMLRQALEHYQAGRLEDVERLCRLMQGCESVHPLSYFYLALVWHARGRSDEEEVCYRQAIAIWPEFVEALNNLGFLLCEQNRLEDAEVCSRRVLEIRSDSVDACVCLGVNLHMQGRDSESETYFCRALAIDSNCFAASLNLGHLKKSIDLSVAEQMYSQAISIKPNSSEVYYHLGGILFCQGRFEEAEQVYLQAVGFDFDGWVGHILRDLAIVAWLRNERDKARMIVEKLAMNCDYSDMIFLWVRQLIEYYYSSSAVMTGLGENCSRIYVVGDSHCLAAHSHEINFLNRSFVLNSYYVRGIRMWDLAMPDNNEKKLYVLSVLSRLPPNATVMFLIGEIDCRPHGGMFKTARKQAGERRFSDCLEEVIRGTVSGYLAWISEAINRFNILKVIVHGVHATIYTLAMQRDNPENADDFLQFLQRVNHRLEQDVLARGWCFLDAYAATKTEQGVTNRRWDVDGVHLKPEFYDEAGCWIKRPYSIQTRL
ncbi:MAG: tetratricopeptide repeat protein [Magnetococcales bacterium]|nr:tetratricopeptide repeat protein [Magnetococcales bacterium]